MSQITEHWIYLIPKSNWDTTSWLPSSLVSLRYQYTWYEGKYYRLRHRYEPNLSIPSEIRKILCITFHQVNIWFAANGGKGLTPKKNGVHDRT